MCTRKRIEEIKTEIACLKTSLLIYCYCDIVFIHVSENIFERKPNPIKYCVS